MTYTIENFGPDFWIVLHIGKRTFSSDHIFSRRRDAVRAAESMGLVPRGE